MRRYEHSRGEQHDKDRIKLYKTHRGWMTSLTRIFRFVFRDRSSKEEFTDRDALKEDDDDTGISPFVQGLTAIAALFGGGAAASAYTQTVHAKQISNNGSEVIGSTSSSSAITRTAMGQQVSQQTVNGQQVSQSVNNQNVDVSNQTQLKHALQDKNVSVINFDNDITLTQTINVVPRNVTINANGYQLNTGNYCLSVDSAKGSTSNEITLKNARLFTANKHGAFEMSHDGNVKLTYQDVDAVGGTAVWSNSEAKGNKSFKVAGQTSIKAVKSYHLDGHEYRTHLVNQPVKSFHKGQTNLIVINNSFTTAKDAKVHIDGAEVADYAIRLMSNGQQHFKVDQNAQFTVDDSNNASIVMTQHGKTDQSQLLQINKDANVSLNSKHGANILLSTSGQNSTPNVNVGAAKLDMKVASHAQANIKVQGPTNNDHHANVSFDKNSLVNGTVLKSGANIVSQGMDTDVNIHNPRHITLNAANNHTYQTHHARMHINIDTTNVKVTN